MTDDTNCEGKPSFAEDIMPIFYQFQKQMIWRFDLTKYEDVKTNYEQILSRITDPDAPMPPAPYGPLAQTDIDTFVKWSPCFNK